MDGHGNPRGGSVPHAGGQANAPTGAAPRTGLTDEQYDVLSSVEKDTELSDAAAEAGVSLPDVVRWIENDPLFRSGLEQIRRTQAEQALLDLQRLRVRAALVLGELMDCPGTPPDVKLRTALAIIDRTQEPPDRAKVWSGWDPRGHSTRVIILKEPPGQRNGTDSM